MFKDNLFWQKIFFFGKILLVRKDLSVIITLLELLKTVKERVDIETIGQYICISKIPMLTSVQATLRCQINE